MTEFLGGQIECVTGKFLDRAALEPSRCRSPAPGHGLPHEASGRLRAQAPYRQSPLVPGADDFVQPGQLRQARRGTGTAVPIWLDPGSMRRRRIASRRQSSRRGSAVACVLAAVEARPQRVRCSRRSPWRCPPWRATVGASAPGASLRDAGRVHPAEFGPPISARPSLAGQRAPYAGEDKGEQIHDDSISTNSRRRPRSVYFTLGPNPRPTRLRGPPSKARTSQHEEYTWRSPV